MRVLWVILPMLLLQGCLGLMRSDQPDEPVIGSMSQQRPALEIRPDEVLKTNREQVQAHYNKLLEQDSTQRNVADMRQLAVEASRRVADFELEQRQEKLFAVNEEVDLQQASLEPAIRRYEQLLRSNPDYKNNDRILYQLARANGNAGRLEQAHQVLSTLVTTYPQSPHFLEAQFRRAEYLFFKQAYAESAAAYRSVIEGGTDTLFYQRALYKLGWSQYKQQKLGGAVDTFVNLLDNLLADNAQQNGDDALLGDTLRITSMVFSALGGSTAIGDYFTVSGHRPYEYRIYQRLGELYQEQGRIRDAAQAYLAFVQLDPTHPQAPGLQVREIEVYAAAGFVGQSWTSKKAFIERYRNDGETWRQLDSGNQVMINRHLHRYLSELASEAHANAQQLQKSKKRAAKQRQQVYLDEAAHWYRSFITLFPQDEKTGGVNFLLAELLFDQRKFNQAFIEYEKAAYNYPAHDKSAEAGYALLLTHARVKKESPEEALVWEKQGIANALRFAESFPQDSRRAQVMVDAAERLFKLAEYAQAAEVARQVIQQQAPAVKDKLILSAWKIAAHASFELAQFAQAEQGYQEVLQRLPRRSKQRKDFVERLAAAIYKQGEQERLTERHDSAAAHFLRVAELTPTASIRATADYDAAASLIAGKAWSQAVAVLERFERNHPDFPQQADVRKKLALGYLNTDRPVKAAAAFSQIAKTDQSPEIRRDAAWQAAELYQKSDARYDAIRAYKYYVKTFPEPMAQALEGREQLVGLYQQQKEIAKRDYWLRQIIKTDKQAGDSRTDRSRYLAAKASYILSEPLFEAFTSVELRIPLKKSLKQKKKRMKAAIQAYSDLADYQVADFTTLATFRMAKIYQHLAHTLIESDRPKGLNEEELEQYEMLLEEQAYPFEEKAIEIYQANADRTTMGIYDEWVRKSFAELAILNPARYAKQERAAEVINVRH